MQVAVTMTFKGALAPLTGVVARLDADVKQSSPGPARISAADAVGQGPTEGGHPIQDVAREQRLSLPPG